MNYQELEILSRFINPLIDQGPVVVKAQSFSSITTENGKRLLISFFQGREEVALTRKDILKIRRGNIELFLLSVLFWGFPSNQRGRCTKAINNWDALVILANAIKNHPNMTNAGFRGHFHAMDSITGLGISSYSKILYFLQVSIEGNQCLILDNMVAKGITNLMGNEFQHLRAATECVRHRYYRYYPLYLEAMNNLSTDIGVPAQNLEYVLWLAGKKNL